MSFAAEAVSAAMAAAASVVASRVLADAAGAQSGARYALGDVFGGQGRQHVGAVIADAFNAPSFTDIGGQASFGFKLAPSYRNLNSQSMREMDDKMKVAIVGTVNLLGQAVKSGRVNCWEVVLAIMDQNELLEPHPADRPVDVRDSYRRGSADAFRFDGSPDGNTVRDIANWFRRAVGDEEVLAATPINEPQVEQLARIVASTGAFVSDVGAFFHREVTEERTLLDVGVLGFPDIDHPYFKIYRLRLHAWRHCNRTLFAETNDSRLDVDFNCRKYVPRESYLAGMKEEVIKTAANEADHLFDD